MGFFSESQKDIDEKSQIPLGKSDFDPEKHAKIVAKLCSKRQELEQRARASSDDSLKEELSELRGAMSVFGISEIDYHAYLTKAQQTATQGAADRKSLTEETTFQD